MKKRTFTYTKVVTRITVAKIHNNITLFMLFLALGINPKAYSEITRGGIAMAKEDAVHTRDVIMLTIN